MTSGWGDSRRRVVLLSALGRKAEVWSLYARWFLGIFLLGVGVQLYVLRVCHTGCYSQRACTAARNLVRRHHTQLSESHDNMPTCPQTDATEQDSQVHVASIYYAADAEPKIDAARTFRNPRFPDSPVCWFLWPRGDKARNSACVRLVCGVRLEEIVELVPGVSKTGYTWQSISERSSCLSSYQVQFLPKAQRRFIFVCILLLLAEVYNIRHMHTRTRPAYATIAGLVGH